MQCIAIAIIIIYIYVPILDIHIDIHIAYGYATATFHFRLVTLAAVYCNRERNHEAHDTKSQYKQVMIADISTHHKSKRSCSIRRQHQG